MNELIWLSILILSFICIFGLYKFFGKIGLYAWLIIALIISNIQVIQIANLFGSKTALGIIMFSTTYLVIHIIIEKYGYKEAKKAVGITMATMIITTLLMYLTTLITPSDNQVANDSLKLIFTINIRIFIGSIVAYLISQSYNISLYTKLKAKHNNIYISGTISTIMAQLIDTIIFMSIAYMGTNILIELFITRYTFKVILAIIDTPIIYLINNIKSE